MASTAKRHGAGVLAADPATGSFAERLRNLPLTRIIALGLFFGAYTDFLGGHAVGHLLSLGLFAVIVGLALVRGFGPALQVFIVTMLLSPLVDRDTVQIVQLTGAPAPVYGLMTTRIASFTLAQWGFVFFGGLAVLHRLRSSRQLVIPAPIRRVFLVNLFVLLVMLMATLVDSLIAREFIDLRAIISDLRFFLIIFLATFTAMRFLEEPAEGQRRLEEALLVAAIAGGVKAVFFLAHDFIAQRTSLYFNPQPYVFFPVFFATLFLFRDRLGPRFVFVLAMEFLAAFSISRGDIFFGLLCTVIFVVLLLFSPNSPAQRVRTARTLVTFSAAMAGVVVGGIFVANPSAFTFLVYKASFFTNVLLGNDLGESASLRIYELRNILSEALARGYPLLIGKGFGGYFSLIDYPVPFRLGDGSYVPAALARQRYMNPHGFVQYTFLKGGVLFLAYYLGLIASAALLALRRLRQPGGSHSLLLAMLPFLSLFALNMFWRPPIIFLFFLILNLVLMARIPDAAPPRTGGRHP